MPNRMSPSVMPARAYRTPLQCPAPADFLGEAEPPQPQVQAEARQARTAHREIAESPGPPRSPRDARTALRQRQATALPPPPSRATVSNAVTPLMATSDGGDRRRPKRHRTATVPSTSGMSRPVLADAGAPVAGDPRAQQPELWRHRRRHRRVQRTGQQRHPAPGQLGRLAARLELHRRQRAGHAPRQRRLHHAGQEPDPAVGRPHQGRSGIQRAHAPGLGSAARRAMCAPPIPSASCAK